MVTFWTYAGESGTTLKKIVGTKSLICQIMIANKVPNFPSLFSKFLLKISASIYTPTHFEHVLHVHAKSFFDKN